MLWALALEGLTRGEQEELLALVNDDRQTGAERLERTRQLYQQAGVFEKAYALVDKYQDRAAAFADTVAPTELRRLLHYLIETVLEHPADPVALAEPAMCIELSGSVPTLT